MKEKKAGNSPAPHFEGYSVTQRGARYRKYGGGSTENKPRKRYKIGAAMMMRGGSVGADDCVTDFSGRSDVKIARQGTNGARCKPSVHIFRLAHAERASERAHLLLRIYNEAEPAGRLTRFAEAYISRGRGNFNINTCKRQRGRETMGAGERLFETSSRCAAAGCDATSQRRGCVISRI